MLDTEVTLIDADQLRDELAHGSNFAFIDVNERGEYIVGHIPSAVNIERGTFDDRLSTLVPGKDTQLLLTCADGRRSTSAARVASQLGYTKIAVLSGGNAGWIAAGHELEFGDNTFGKRYGEQVLAQSGVELVSPEELDSLQQAGDVVIFDVRMEHEYLDEGHLQGAINTPGAHVAPYVFALRENAESDFTVVLNCAGRTRSIIAAEKLMQLGVENVVALRNGTMAWLLADRELNVGHTATRSIDVSAQAQTSLREAVQQLAATEGVPSISVADLHRSLDERQPIFVLDVRSREEAEQNILPGAQWCPEGQLTNFLDNFVAVRDATIVCYSNNQTRAILSARTLRGMGCPNAVWLEGGFDAWVAAGNPATQLPAAPEWDDPSFIEVESLGEELPHEVVDIRRMSAFMSGHIPGSVYIPHGLLEFDAPARITAGAPVLVISDDPRQARRAIATVSNLGFKSVHALSGGISAWEESGRETATGMGDNTIDLIAAREEADLVGHGPLELRRDRADMERYLRWEIELEPNSTETVE